jgi:pimeloyl-ACP methyl ester carboxylesterase
MTVVHLLVALYRSGRQADALAAYQRARRLLRDELGLEPGGELQRLERAILGQDPSLLGPAAEADATPQAAEVRRSPVRYAVTPDGTHVAYQIVGNGPLDVLAIPGFVSHLDMWWDSPTDHLVRKLASFSRLILFDKRGMGLSDRPGSIDVEYWVEDSVAVLDAVGSERAVILGISAGVPTAILFAAMYPQRVSSLILYGGFARFIAGDGNDLGLDAAAVDRFVRHMEANWGTGAGISTLAPSRARDPAAREYWARLQTRSASPAAAAKFLRALADIDVRHALTTISSPTLILHANRDQNVPIGAARAMRGQIKGAELVELDSDIHLIWLSDVIDEATRHLADFISRAIRARDADRALATILAVGPVRRAPHQDAVIDSIVERSRGTTFRGTTLASFDGAARAVRCAVALVSELPRIGVAVHSGECETSGEQVRGVAVDIATQLAATAEPGQVLVSQTVRDLLLGSAIDLRPHRRQSFKDVPGQWEVFSVDSASRVGKP